MDDINKDVTTRSSFGSPQVESVETAALHQPFNKYCEKHDQFMGHCGHSHLVWVRSQSATTIGRTLQRFPTDSLDSFQMPKCIIHHQWKLRTSFCPNRMKTKTCSECDPIDELVLIHSGTTPDRNHKKYENQADKRQQNEQLEPNFKIRRTSPKHQMLKLNKILTIK